MATPQLLLLAPFLRRAQLARISVYGGKPDVLNQRAGREKMTRLYGPAVRCKLNQRHARWQGGSTAGPSHSRTFALRTEALRRAATSPPVLTIPCNEARASSTLDPQAAASVLRASNAGRDPIAGWACAGWLLSLP